MKTKNFFAFIAVFCFGLFENLIAQEAPRVVPGSRIRVSAPTFSSDRLIGTVVSKSEDTLTLAPSSGTARLAIPFMVVKRLEVSRGRAARGKNALKGAVIGTLVGGVGGFVLEAGVSGDQAVAPLVGAIGGAFNGSLIGASGKYATIGFLSGLATGALIGLASDEEGDDTDAATWALIGASFGGEIGILLGGLVGLASDAERWQQVPLEQVRFGLMPHRNNGLAFSASFTF